MKQMWFVGATFAVALGCSSPSGPSSVANPPAKPPTLAALSAISLAGKGAGYAAADWVNGVSQTLGGSPGAYLVWATAFQGTHLLVGGVDYGGKPTVWTDGVPANWQQSPGSTTAVIRSLVVSGTDVYAMGYEIMPKNTVERSWKNGVLFSQSIPTAQDDPSTAYGGWVDGTDVYAVGYTEDHTTKVQVATYWKNGVAVRLADTTHVSMAHALQVHGGSVWVAGQLDGVGTLWKDGVVVESLSSPDPAYSTEAWGLAWAGTDEIVVGVAGDTAQAWVNGVRTPLSNSKLGNNAQEWVWQVVTWGTDWYAVGHGTGGCGYWKNGTFFPDVNIGSAYAIAVR